jgi:hypothetical protein
VHERDLAACVSPVNGRADHDLHHDKLADATETLGDLE